MIPIRPIGPRSAAFTPPGATHATQVTDATHPSIRILLFRGRGLISALIRWQTGSHYSHAAALIDNTWLYEAWQGAGVRMKPFNWSDTANIDCFEIVGLTPGGAVRMLEYLQSRVGNKYDYWGVLRFVTRARPKRNKADFCSEYIYSAAECAGHPLMARTQPAEVSPGLLSRSPFLRQVPLFVVPSRDPVDGPVPASPLPQLPPVKMVQHVLRVKPLSPATTAQPTTAARRPAYSTNRRWQPKGTPMKTKIHQPSTIIHQPANAAPLIRGLAAVAKLACGIRTLRLHPKFRWLSYACPILTVAPDFRPAPPEGPPKLRLRKRRLSVRKS